MNTIFDLLESNDASTSAESLLLRNLEESLPDLWIVSTDADCDIRDAQPDEDYMLDWHYPGKCSVHGLVPDLDVSEPDYSPALTTQVPRSRLVARGVLSGGRTIQADY